MRWPPAALPPRQASRPPRPVRTARQRSPSLPRAVLPARATSQHDRWSRVRDVRQPRAFYAADSLHTEIYDALAVSTTAGSSVGSDIDFYRQLASETGGPILDVGCGNG